MLQIKAVSVREFKNGMTVKELREIVSSWPLYDAHTGEESTVWVSLEVGSSDQVKGVCPLNYRVNDGHISADLLLEI
jgi:hypothetical protein